MRLKILLSFFIFPFLIHSQVQEIKVMTYNLMYYKDANAPCPQNIPAAQKDAAFQTVFKAINPDILCVNELVGFSDNSGAASILTNVINTQGESNFASANYSNNSFSTITNMLFYDSTLFGLDSQIKISQTITNIDLPRVIDIYRLYYKDPKFSIGGDTTFFRVVVGHLKASTGTANKDKREDAAKAIMAYLTDSVADENVILCGDLNLYTSSEGAYQQFTNYSVSAEQFVDPGPTGSWNNNQSFSSHHTQSTHASQSGCFAGGGLDDRFDFIMYSKSISTGSSRMKYKFNSHKVIGNDGAHFNQSINAGTNTSVSQQVANALYNFSDHLPVIAEFIISPSDVSIAELSLNEHLVVTNPFKELLKISTLESLQNNYTIVVYSMNGKEMYRNNWNDNQTVEISTHSWPKGIYSLNIYHAKGAAVSKKLVKY